MLRHQIKWLNNLILRHFIFMIFLPILLSTGCGDEVKVVTFTTDEATRLLSGDTTKSWLRTAYVVNGQPQYTDPCELQTITTFLIDASDSAKFVVHRHPDICPGNSDTLETGYWRVVGKITNADIADRIEFVLEGDTLLRNIDMITSLYLDLSLNREGSSEQSSFEAILPE